MPRLNESSQNRAELPLLARPLLPLRGNNRGGRGILYDSHVKR
jgi:hypothetical protein